MNTSEALNIKTKIEKDQREKANFFNNIMCGLSSKLQGLQASQQSEIQYALAMEMKILEAKADAAVAAKQVDCLKRKQEIIEEQAHLKAQEVVHQAHQAQLKVQEEARQAKVEAVLSTLKQTAKAEELMTRAQVLQQGLKESLFTFCAKEIEC
uniref:Uncharacterized protein n=1 Tax=Sphaerodactylus townsendi TaxID=933632 RepID=A0ACB8GDW8_9SAUR